MATDKMRMNGDVLLWGTDLMKVQDPNFGFGCVMYEILGNIQIKVSNAVGYEDPTREEMRPGNRTLKVNQMEGETRQVDTLF